MADVWQTTLLTKGNRWGQGSTGQVCGRTWRKPPQTVAKKGTPWGWNLPAEEVRDYSSQQKIRTPCTHPTWKIPVTWWVLGFADWDYDFWILTLQRKARKDKGQLAWGAELSRTLGLLPSRKRCEPDLRGQVPWFRWLNARSWRCQAYPSHQVERRYVKSLQSFWKWRQLLPRWNCVVPWSNDGNRLAVFWHDYKA